MTIRSALAVLALLAFLGWIPRDASATPSARLLYVRNTGTETCPDEAEFRKAVAARLGYDPFFPWAKTTVLATLDHDATGFHGLIEVLDEHSTVLGRRALTSRGSECVEIARTMGLAVSVALDDLDLGAEGPPPAPPPPPEPPKAPPPKEPETPPGATPSPPPEPVAALPVVARPSSTPIVYSMALGPTATVGLAPSPSLGAELAFRGKRSWFSVALAARGELPSSGVYLGSTVTTYTFAGEILPCVHPTNWLYACAVGAFGIYYEHGSVGQPGGELAPFVALGARAGVEIPVGRRFFVDAHLDGLVPVTTIDVTVGAGTTPSYDFKVTPVLGTVGVAPGFRF